MATPNARSASTPGSETRRGFPVIFTLHLSLANAWPGRAPARVQETLCFLFEPVFNRRQADTAMGEAIRALGGSWPQGPASERERWRSTLFDSGPGAMVSASLSRELTLGDLDDADRDEAIVLAAAAFTREIGEALAVASSASQWARAKDRQSPSRAFVSLLEIFEQLDAARAACEARRQIEAELASPTAPSTSRRSL